MAQTQLISMRIEKDSIKRIEALCESRRYLNRSIIINLILTAVLFCCDDDGILDIVHSFDPISDGLKIKVIAKPQI